MAQKYEKSHLFTLFLMLGSKEQNLAITSRQHMASCRMLKAEESQSPRKPFFRLQLNRLVVRIDARRLLEERLEHVRKEHRDLLRFHSVNGRHGDVVAVGVSVGSEEMCFCN
jgi:hypothetical protein